MERFEFIGNLGKDAVIRTTQSGERYAIINVAVKRVRNGEAYTFWHNNIEIIAPTLVEYAEKYFKKGCTLFCSCTTDNRKYILQDSSYIFAPVFILTSFEFVGKNTSEQEAVFAERGDVVQPQSIAQQPIQQQQYQPQPTQQVKPQQFPSQRPMQPKIPKQYQNNTPF